MEPLWTSPATLKALVSAVAMCASIGLMFSGTPQMLDVIRAGNTGSKTFGPFAAMLLDNAAGLWFSTLIQDVLSFRLRTMGTVLNVCYIGIMIAYSRNKRQDMTVLTGVLAAIAAAWVGVNAVAHPKSHVDVLGSINTATAIAFAASPLANIGTVISSKDASSIPFPLCTALAVCASSWAVYGMLIRG